MSKPQVRLVPRIFGAHVQVSVYVGPPGAGVNHGTIVFRPADWEAFAFALSEDGEGITIQVQRGD